MGDMCMCLQSNELQTTSILFFYPNLCQKYQDTKLLTIRHGILQTALQDATPYSFHRAHHFDTSKMTKVS